ncbi:MAG: Choline-sulfatase [candidate division BRC1 bacterium ADurb.BinA364]|nr:MAG: Choline-sulfatase [candidate division BRC1 bacterium ADurb.BinA364]
MPRVSRNERDKYGFANLRDEQIVKAREIYYGMVRYVDGLIGEILAKLDELGLRENTIVLYTSDHGELAGEHGLWYKNSYYEASVRVPHVWSFPKVLPQGATVSTPTMNMDILPTLCDLCGLDKPEGLEGASLLPLMLGQEDGKDRVAFSENFRGGMPSRMIRTDRWKYCYYVDDIEQLFDMREDPEETVNLVDRPEHRELVAALKAQALEGWDYKAYLARKRELAKAGALSSEGEE